jgi:hypothetical protein
MRDTIDMAREAGADTLMYWDIEKLKRFAEIVRADERADCERVVGIALLGAEMDLAKRVLRAIRNRGNP